MKNATKANGHSKGTPEIMAALANLAKLLTPQAPAVAQAPAPAMVEKAKRKPRVARVEAPKPLRPADYPEHDHTTARILGATIPTAANCRAGVDGAGVILHVVCACGMEGYLEVPAADAEAMAQTACWKDEE